MFQTPNCAIYEPSGEHPDLDRPRLSDPTEFLHEREALQRRAAPFGRGAAGPQEVAAGPLIRVRAWPRSEAYQAGLGQLLRLFFAC